MESKTNGSYAGLQQLLEPIFVSNNIVRIRTICKICDSYSEMRICNGQQGQQQNDDSNIGNDLPLECCHYCPNHGLLPNSKQSNTFELVDYELEYKDGTRERFERPTKFSARAPSYSKELCEYKEQCYLFAICHSAHSENEFLFCEFLNKNQQFDFDDILIALALDEKKKAVEISAPNQVFSFSDHMFNLVRQNDLAGLKKVFKNFKCTLLELVDHDKKSLLQVACEDFAARKDVTKFLLDMSGLSKGVFRFRFIPRFYWPFLCHISNDGQTFLTILLKQLQDRVESADMMEILTKVIDLHCEDFDLDEQIKIDDKQTTTLHQLIEHNQTTLVKYFVDKVDIDFNKQNHRGLTPLIAAYESKLSLQFKGGDIYELISSKLQGSLHKSFSDEELSDCEDETKQHILKSNKQPLNIFSESDLSVDEKIKQFYSNILSIDPAIPSNFAMSVSFSRNSTYNVHTAFTNLDSRKVLYLTANELNEHSLFTQDLISKIQDAYQNSQIKLPNLVVREIDARNVDNLLSSYLELAKDLRTEMTVKEKAQNILFFKRIHLTLASMSTKFIFVFRARQLFDLLKSVIEMLPHNSKAIVIHHHQTGKTSSKQHIAINMPLLDSNANEICDGNSDGLKSVLISEILAFKDTPNSISALITGDMKLDKQKPDSEKPALDIKDMNHVIGAYLACLTEEQRTFILMASLFDEKFIPEELITTEKSADLQKLLANPILLQRIQTPAGFRMNTLLKRALNEYYQSWAEKSSLIQAFEIIFSRPYWAKLHGQANTSEFGYIVKNLEQLINSYVSIVGAGAVPKSGSRQVADHLNRLGCHFKNINLKRSCKYLKMELELRNQAGHDAGSAKNIADLGDTLYFIAINEKNVKAKERHLDEALEYLQTAETLCPNLNLSWLTANVCYSIGRVHLAKGNLSSGLECAKTLEKIREKDPILLGKLYSSLAQTYLLKSQYEDAQKFSSEAIRIFSKLPTQTFINRYLLANEYLLSGKIHSAQCQESSSIQRLFESLRLFSALLTPLGGSKSKHIAFVPAIEIADVLSNLGEATNNHEEKELSYHKLALKTYDKLFNNQPNYPSARETNNIGVSLEAEYPRVAVVYQLRSLRMLESLPKQDPEEIAFQLRNVGSTFNRLMRYDEALECLSKSYKLYKRILGRKKQLEDSDRSDLGFVLLELGIACLHKRKELALGYFKRALCQYFLIKSTNIEYRYALYNYIVACIKLGKNTKSRKCFDYWRKIADSCVAATERSTSDQLYQEQELMLRKFEIIKAHIDQMFAEESKTDTTKKRVHEFDFILKPTESTSSKHQCKIEMLKTGQLNHSQCLAIK